MNEIINIEKNEIIRILTLVLSKSYTRERVHAVMSRAISCSNPDPDQTPRNPFRAQQKTAQKQTFIDN